MDDWTQTPNTVTITVPLAYRVSPQDINYQITDTFIKLNIPKQGVLKLFDLFDEINSETAKIVLEDKKVIFYLDKVKLDKWLSLDYNGLKEEKISRRRKIAEEKYLKRMDAIEERSKEQKKINERYVFDKSTQMGDERRKELNERKMEEKTDAERELYEFVNVVDNRDAAKKDVNMDGIIEEVDTSTSLKPSEQHIESKSETSIIPRSTMRYSNVLKFLLKRLRSEKKLASRST
jgi:hypothetical protein